MTVPVFDFVGKKKICIICEGYEEKEYLERLKSFGAWQGRYYDVHLVNAKSISNIAPRYQEILCLAVMIWSWFFVIQIAIPMPDIMK